jgi:hypothetical protein
MGCLLHSKPTVQDLFQGIRLIPIPYRKSNTPQLKAISLSKNVVRSIDAQTDLPPFELFPASHRVTYKYYVGLLSFLQEDYAKVGHQFLSQPHVLTPCRQKSI